MSEFSGYEPRENGRVGTIVLALSIGLAVGVAGTLLLAPASGRNTRRRIGEFAGAVTNKTSHLAQRAGDVLRARANQVEGAFADGKQAFRQAKDTHTS